MTHKPLLVIKIGTSSLTSDNGTLDLNLIESLASQFKILSSEYELLLVSSGAVGVGKQYIKDYTGTRSQKKAAAAIGNPILMSHYASIFYKHELQVAQCLLERNHFHHKPAYTQLQDTIKTLWANHVIPICNDNDVINDLEIRFSDNDELATLLAVAFGAKALIIGSSIDGLLDTDNQVVRLVKSVNADILALDNKEKSSVGLGGMTSKLNFAKLATRMGVNTYIFNSRAPKGIIQTLHNEIGTYFVAHSSTPTTQQRWIAAGSIIDGGVQVDDGALWALQNRKSLLAVGVTHVVGTFQKGEIIKILDTTQTAIAYAKTEIDSNFLQENLQKQNILVAHANFVVAF